MGKWKTFWWNVQFEKDLGSRVGHKCCILSLCVCFIVGAAHCFNTFDDYLLVEQTECGPRTEDKTDICYVSVVRRSHILKQSIQFYLVQVFRFMVCNSKMNCSRSSSLNKKKKKTKNWDLFDLFLLRFLFGRKFCSFNFYDSFAINFCSSFSDFHFIGYQNGH